MIEQHIPRKCVKCQREHNAPGNTCFLCMNEAIGGSVPQRVGIARRGDLVILEQIAEESSEHKCQIAHILGEISKDLGIRFIVLDAKHMRLARIGDDNDQKELAAWRAKWGGLGKSGFFYSLEHDRVGSLDEDGNFV